MEQRLEFVFSTVNEWLRFLETKHTALIALNGAAIVGLVQALSSIGNASLKQLIPYWLIPGLLCSLLLSLFSMTQWAITVAPLRQKKRVLVANPLYFGYISALKGPDFQAELIRIGCTNEPVCEFDLALIPQIHINAKIAFAKQRLFHWAITTTFLSVGVCFLIFLIKRWFFAAG
ncbi:MAG: hypothetical protein EOO61_00025 [Hymenobacter sp.]|nr:MAG: hypothetical protein EOO61_00025 [Hymenobacter sp.]